MSTMSPSLIISQSMNPVRIFFEKSPCAVGVVSAIVRTRLLAGLSSRTGTRRVGHGMIRGGGVWGFWEGKEEISGCDDLALLWIDSYRCCRCCCRPLGREERRRKRMSSVSVFWERRRGGW